MTSRRSLRLVAAGARRSPRRCSSPRAAPATATTPGRSSSTSRTARRGRCAACALGEAVCPEDVELTEGVDVPVHARDRGRAGAVHGPAHERRRRQGPDQPRAGEGADRDVRRRGPRPQRPEAAVPRPGDDQLRDRTSCSSPTRGRRSAASSRSTASSSRPSPASRTRTGRSSSSAESVGGAVARRRRGAASPTRRAVSSRNGSSRRATTPAGPRDLGPERRAPRDRRPAAGRGLEQSPRRGSRGPGGSRR